MRRQLNLARLFNLSASSLNLGLRASRNLVNLDREGLGELAVAENLDEVFVVLDDALFDEGVAPARLPPPERES